MDIFNVILLANKVDKVIYALLVPLWWSIALIIAVARPDFFGYVSVVSASTLLNLTYTLPPLFCHGLRHSEKRYPGGPRRWLRRKPRPGDPK
jgi:hypothetical protein